jgi:hypothetical protein
MKGKEIRMPCIHKKEGRNKFIKRQTLNINENICKEMFNEDIR